MRKSICLKIVYVGLALCFSFSLFAQMPILGADSLMRHYNKKMHQYIDRDSALDDHYLIDIFGISIFAGAKEKKANKPEYRLYWSELQIFKNMYNDLSRKEVMDVFSTKGNKSFSGSIVKHYSNFSPPVSNKSNAISPLKGLKIALDPGHIASDTAMGRLEDKYLLFNLQDDSQKSEPTLESEEVVSMAEGMLTWQTANALALLLRKQGAEVFLTRPQANITAFGKTYQQWKKYDYKRTLDSLCKINPTDVRLKKLRSGKINKENIIFRYVFRDAELRKRAQVINAFNPDLTIFIHYNVDEKNKPWVTPTSQNYCMTFVPGSFQQNELSDFERRFDFLRLLVTQEIENSIIAAGITARHFQTELNVPLAKITDATYLLENCIPAGPGVFCRNLSLTRLVQGTIIYGEALYQDNFKECLRLIEKPNAASENQYPFILNARLTAVVAAYNKAVLEWAKSK